MYFPFVNTKVYDVVTLGLFGMYVGFWGWKQPLKQFTQTCVYVVRVFSSHNLYNFGIAWDLHLEYALDHFSVKSLPSLKNEYHTCWDSLKDLTGSWSCLVLSLVSQMIINYGRVNSDTPPKCCSSHTPLHTVTDGDTLRSLKNVFGQAVNNESC